MPRVLADIYNKTLWRSFVIWQNRVTDRLASALITPSKALKERLVSEGVNPDKIHVVCNGISIPRIDDPAQTAASVQKEFGIPKDIFLVGTAGRMVAIKNLETLIEMAAQLIHDGLMLNVLLIGDGPRREHLENLARSLGVSQYIVFSGWRNDVSRLLQAIDLYVLPSLEEIFPYSVLEAMASGKPVIAFDTGSLSEVILHGETGFLVTSGDTTAFKNAVAALSLDPIRARQLGQAGKNRVHRFFRAEEMVEKIEPIYQSIL
jgi:glycosyltransferase involved in cell wall biosynthesis